MLCWIRQVRGPALASHGHGRWRGWAGGSCSNSCACQQPEFTDDDVTTAANGPGRGGGRRPAGSPSCHSCAVRQPRAARPVASRHQQHDSSAPGQPSHAAKLIVVTACPPPPSPPSKEDSCCQSCCATPVRGKRHLRARLPYSYPLLFSKWLSGGPPEGPTTVAHSCSFLLVIFELPHSLFHRVRRLPEWVWY